MQKNRFLNCGIFRIVTLVFLGLFLTPTPPSFAQEQQNQNSQLAQDLKVVSDFSNKLSELTKERKSTLKNIEKGLVEVSNITSGAKSSLAELRFFYDRVTLDWRVLADSSLQLFSSDGGLNYDRPLALGQEGSEILTENYEQLLRDRNRFVEEAKNLQLTLLLEVGKYRADLLSSILEQNSDFLTIHSAEYFQDLFRELKLIPYRPLMFFYSKILNYERLIQQGFKGVVEISKQIFSLVFFIAILTIGSKLLHHIRMLLGRFRSNLFNRSIQNPRNNRFANLISLLVPYSSWIFLIIVFDVAQLFIKQTALAEIGALLPYFIYYFSYRILRIFLNSFFSKNFSQLSFGKDFQHRANLTSRFLGRYFLTSAYLLHLTESIVRKALIYNIIYGLIFYGIIISSIFLSALWREEILLKVEQKLSTEIALRIRKFTSTRFAILYSLPLLITVSAVTILQNIFILISNNDLAKNILSQIYRRKLESAAKNSENNRISKNLPQSYLDNFNKESNLRSIDFIKIDSHPYEEIKQIIGDWSEKKIQENSLVIYGKSGMGKTIMLDWVRTQFKIDDLKTVELTLTKKIISEKELSDMLVDLLEIDLSAQSLEESIKNYPTKILVILDDCHNLFLAKRGGLAAFKLFANLVNMSNSNIFWITSFSAHSWSYLFNALDTSNYFCHSFRLLRWSDRDIQELILTKHKKSGLRMSYDSLIFDMQTHDSSQDLSDINQKFFRMLWSQSKGNPRIALDLWLSSLNLTGRSNIQIHLPKTVKSANLVDLSNEQLFVYAAIAKHRELLSSDIIDIVRLPRGIVLSALRLGIERGHLDYENHKYYIASSWQNEITQLLINKNFIYE
jgi:DNA replication protein DnaC